METVLILEVKVENDGIVAFGIEVKHTSIFIVINMQDTQIERAKNHFIQIFFTVVMRA